MYNNIGCIHTKYYNNKTKNNIRKLRCYDEYNNVMNLPSDIREWLKNSIRGTEDCDRCNVHFIFPFYNIEIDIFILEYNSVGFDSCLLIKTHCKLFNNEQRKNKTIELSFDKISAYETSNKVYLVLSNLIRTILNKKLELDINDFF